MKRSIDIDIDLQPEEMADMIWEEYADDDQAMLLNKLANIWDSERPGVEMQMLGIADNIWKSYRNNAKTILGFLGELMEWIKLRENKEGEGR